MIDVMSFATRLKEARKAAGLKQRELAQACGLTNRAVSAWEKGRADGMLAKHLSCVAEKLRVDPRWLAMGDIGNSNPPTALSEILRGLESLSSDQQEAVRNLILSLRK
jgi:transcriptional regulator with XRE-family HTH domain